MKKKKQALILLSGGLDSRLACKILQEQLGKDNVIALYFDLPFGAGCCSINCAFNFSQRQGLKLHVIDCSKGKNLQQYINIIKKPKFGYGSAFNPCIDCRIFMLKKAKQFADNHKNKIRIIATGEVFGERPMSQTKSALQLIDKEIGFEILRPLSAKLLPKTEAEKQGLIDREKLYNIQGRSRRQQIELAKKFKINYPSPAGGCLLCEKEFASKLRFLFKNKIKIDEQAVKLLKIGRHFFIDSWLILGRNEKENKMLEMLKASQDTLVVPEKPGPSVLLIKKTDKKLKDKINKLIEAYSKGKTKERKKFEKWKI